MADGAVSRGSAGSCAACGTLAVAGDVGGGVWKSGRVSPCIDSGGLSVGSGGGDAAAVSVGSADSVDTAGDETAVAGCWPVSMPDSARRLCVSGTRLRGPRAVSIREVEENRHNSPATARMLAAAAVTPYHQRGGTLLGLYAAIT